MPRLVIVGGDVAIFPTTCVDNTEDYALKPPIFRRLCDQVSYVAASRYMPRILALKWTPETGPLGMLN